MSQDERVVIRSSWPAQFAILAPLAIIFPAVQIWQRSLGGVVATVLVVGAAGATSRYLQHIELTANGLEIQWFRKKIVPWQHIRSVELINRLGGGQLSIFDLAENRSRYLPAPRVAFGVGTKEAVQARDLIERWLLAYSGRPLPAAVRPTLPPVLPGGPDDPYRPPPEE